MDHDLCIIGGGAAGLVVAAGGAALGARVILVEKHRLGGDCLWHGCVPSKTLLHSARVAHTLRRAERFGIPPCTPEIDLAAVMARVQAVVSQVGEHDRQERFEDLGIELCFGAGRFTSPRSFQVGDRCVRARRFVIATGSRPALPAIEGLDRVPFLTNENIFSLAEPVPHLLVLGGGPIGVELAQAFVRLGSAVSLLEAGPRILPREDPDLAAVVAAQLAADGVRFHFNSRALAVAGRAGEISLRYRDTSGAERTLTGSHLLLATGRRANIDGLDLAAAGVAVEEGRIRTDRRLRTRNPRIYACGDVTGPWQFTHMAEHQAGVVLRNALFHLPARVETRAVPWCTFSDPELARVGLSETEARKAGIRHQVFTFPFHDIDRARAEGVSEGLAKIVTGRGGRLLGAAIAGPEAGELIHEYVLALTHRMKAADLARAIHVYPTLAQINRRVADQRLRAGLTPRARRWLQRLFRLRGK